MSEPVPDDIIALRSPLTRWAVQKWGNMDDFKIVTLQTLTVPRDDDEMLHQAEATAIATLRAQGFQGGAQRCTI